MTHSKFYEAISDKFRNHRRELGISQRSVAAKLGISPHSYNHIEKHRRKFSVYELAMLQKLYNFHINLNDYL